MYCSIGSLTAVGASPVSTLIWTHGALANPRVRQRRNESQHVILATLWPREGSFVPCPAGRGVASHTAKEDHKRFG